MRTYAFVFADFKNEFLYWESVIQTRKLLMCLVVACLAPLGVESQTLFALGILVVCIALQVRFKPFLAAEVDTLEYCSLLTSFATLYFGLLLSILSDVDKFGDYFFFDGIGYVLTFLIVAVNGFYLAMYVYFMMYVMRAKALQKMKEYITDNLRWDHNQLVEVEAELKNRAWVGILRYYCGIQWFAQCGWLCYETQQFSPDYIFTEHLLMGQVDQADETWKGIRKYLHAIEAKSNHKVAKAILDKLEEQEEEEEAAEREDGLRLSVSQSFQDHALLDHTSWEMLPVYHYEECSISDSDTALLEGAKNAGIRAYINNKNVVVGNKALWASRTWHITKEEMDEVNTKFEELEAKVGNNGQVLFVALTSEKPHTQLYHTSVQPADQNVSHGDSTVEPQSNLTGGTQAFISKLRVRALLCLRRSSNTHKDDVHEELVSTLQQASMPPNLHVSVLNGPIQEADVELRASPSLMYRPPWGVPEGRARLKC